MHTPRALVRRPVPRLAEGLVTHVERSPVDLDLAVAQWERYVQALEDAGWETLEVEPADDCPDSVFVEDTVVVYGGTAVLASPGAQERRPEVAGTAEVLEEQGYRLVEIEPPGTLDGGDVLKHGGTVWVGVGGRTDEHGARQLRAHLTPLGADVVLVPQTRVLHLKSSVTALPDGTVVGYPALVQDPSVWGERFLAVPEESGAHVVLLGGARILMAADAPGSAQMFRDRGLEVVEVDISEFQKLEGCVTCLSVRLRSLPA